MQPKFFSFFNLILLTGFLLLEFVGSPAADWLVIALQFSTAFALVSLIRTLPVHKKFYHYYPLAIALFIRGFLDTRARITHNEWQDISFQGIAVSLDPPIFIYASFLIPMLLILVSISLYFFTLMQGHDKKQLLIDTYKVAVVIVVSIGSTTINVFQSLGSFHWDFSLFYVSFAFYTVATCLILTFSFILLFLRKIKQNSSPLLGLVFFYLLMAGRHILVTYHMSGELQLNVKITQYMLIAGCMLLTATLQHHYRLFHQEKSGKFVPKLNIPENIEKIHIMLALTIINIAIWAAGLLSTETLLLVTFILFILQSMDILTQRTYVINEQLQKELTIDSLTGLPNRSTFMREVSLHIKQDIPFALFFVNLRRFKVINDIHGPQTGDKVLNEIGNRLLGIQSKTASFFRSGGDEFAVLLLGNDIAQSKKTAGLLTETIEKPLKVDRLDLSMSASIGVAHYPLDTQDTQDLLKYADNAMRNAKQQESSSYLSHSATFASKLERRNRLERKLQSPNFTEGFKLLYQPKIDTKTRELHSMEALVRWFDKDKGLISPAEFIPIAEEVGKIGEISDWVLTTALNQIKTWNETYNTNHIVNVNISPINIHDKMFIAKICDALDETGAKPAWLGIEITEHSAMTSPDFMCKVLAAISNLGIGISIDDFGTGYSSLSYLKRFKVDELKIAKELIDNIEHGHDDYHIVNAIIKMAKGLSLETVAEGVEIQDQLSILEELGCDTIQGYFFEKPLPPEELEERYLKKV